MILMLLGCFIGGDPDTAVEQLCDRDPPLSWDNFGRSFLALHCNGCHSSLLPSGRRGDAPLGVDFDSWEAVLAQVDRIEARGTGDEPSMPPGGGPTEEDVALLAEWLSCDVGPASSDTGAASR